LTIPIYYNAALFTTCRDLQLAPRGIVKIINQMKRQRTPKLPDSWPTSMRNLIRKG